MIKLYEKSLHNENTDAQTLIRSSDDPQGLLSYDRNPLNVFSLCKLFPYSFIISIDEMSRKNRGFPQLYILFFYKNKVYKNIEAENGKILRICLEYFPG